MTIVAHRSGKLVSRIISWFRPPYNHIELWFTNRGVVISADAEGVVSKPVPHVGAIGTGTILDFFVYAPMLTEADEQAAWDSASALVGTDYDYWELFFGFTKKGPSPKSSRSKLICSGVVLKVSQDIKLPLLKRVREDRVAPRDLTRSPLIKWVGSAVKL